MAVRSLISVLAVLVLLVAPEWMAGAHAGEAIVMPFSCSVKSGKPTLNSAAPTRHEIIGVRDLRNYRACKGPGERDCRSMVVYSFDVSCQGKRVAWQTLAAQIRSNDVGLSWIENGELNLILKKSKASASDRRMARYVMPKGYAPIEELGARFVAGAKDSADRVAAGVGAEGEALQRTVQQTTERQTTEPGEASGSRVIVPTIDEAVVVTPEVQADAAIGAAQADDQWTAVVHRGDPGDQGAGGIAGDDRGGRWAFAQGRELAIMAFLMGAISLLAVLGWYGRRRVAPVRGRELAPVMAEAVPAPEPEPEPAERNPFAARMTDAAGGVGAKLHSRWVGFKWRRLQAAKPWEWSNANIENGARSAEALYERAESAVRALGPASSLRDTLSAELNGLRQKLDGLRGGSGEKPKTSRVAASLRAVVRDLVRIGRIAESAAVSVKVSGEKIVMPKTRAEAFEVLGVNANVTEGTLKRIVDALRMGWHPDHAKDEVDKQLREERTKQINIAWDLIAGNRAA